MFHIEDVLQLKDGEQVKAIVRRHVVMLFPRLFVALLLIVVPFFLLFPLFSWGLAGTVGFFAAVLVGVILAIRTLLLWDADVLIVTTLRVIDVNQGGLLARTVAETALSSIQDIAWSHKGLLETVFRMGTITIQTSGAASTIVADRIPRPKRTWELISELRHGPSPRRAQAAEHRDRLDGIMRLLETYSDEELIRVESILKARERSAAVESFVQRDVPPTP